MSCPAIDTRAKYLPCFPKIEQINGEDFRRYRVPNGKLYPSQSSVVGAVVDKSFLIEWRKRVGDKEADRISQHASERGTALHLLCELYATNDDSYELVKRKSMPDALANFAAIRRQLALLDEVRGCEVQMYSDKLRIAGTADMIAVWKGKLSIIDYKTSRRPKSREDIDHYLMQCSGYATMWEELTGEKVEQLVILMAVDGQKECSVFVEDVAPNLAKLKKARLAFFEQHGL